MRQRRIRWVSAFVALGLVAAACGGDDDSAEGDGEEAPAEGGDFEAQAFDESAQCGTEGYAGNLAGIEAVDAQTVTFTLCNPDVAFPSKVAFSALGIFPEEQLEEGGQRGTRRQPDRHRSLQARGLGEGQPDRPDRQRGLLGRRAAIPTVVFRWSEESAQRLVELQSGDVDGIDNVGTEDFETVSGDSNLQLIEREPLNVFYLGFNVDKPPFDNEQLRQAIGYAIDKDRIIENFYPEGSIAADQFLPPGIPQVQEGAETFTYDPRRPRSCSPRPAIPTVSTSGC